MAAAISLTFLAVSVLTVVAVPYTPADAMHHALEANPEPIAEYKWYEYGGSEIHVLELDIGRDDFERSMDRNVLRYGTLLAQSPANLVDPGDRHVRAIADHILSLTEGRSDRDKATAALNFVQTAIVYRLDSENYGCDEFWATPAETLYLHSGDCEDTSILLCSIYLAMGFRCALLDYPGHIAVGVYLGDSDDYLYCETTTSYPTKTGTSPIIGGEPAVYPADSGEGFLGFVTDGLAGLRYLIRDVTGF